MSIRKRGNSFRAEITFKGQRYNASFPNHAEAQFWEQDMLFKLRNGVDVTLKKDVWTLSEGFSKTYQLVWANTRGEKTQRINGKQLMDYFGPNTLLDSIDTESVLEFKLYCKSEKKNSDATVNRKYSCLSKIFSIAEQYKKCNQKPSFIWESEPDGKIRWLTWEEEDQYLLYFDDNQQIKDIIMLGCDTGMRAGEMLSVPFTDYQNGKVNIWTNKNDKPRSVPLTPRVLEMIGRRQMQDPYATTPFSYSYSWIRKLIKKASEDLQYPDVTIHTLRHTFASRLVQAGRPISNIQELMGHKTSAMTQRYAHLAPDHGTEDISVLVNRGVEMAKSGVKMAENYANIQKVEYVTH